MNLNGTQEMEELIKPNQKDFYIPETEMAFNDMMKGLMDQGLDRALATKIIEDRVVAYKKALEEFNEEKKQRILDECT